VTFEHIRHSYIFFRWHKITPIFQPIEKRVTNKIKLYVNDRKSQAEARFSFPKLRKKGKIRHIMIGVCAEARWGGGVNRGHLLLMY
jgi:hypothetical protein